jgi:hypothetical protein
MEEAAESRITVDEIENLARKVDDWYEFEETLEQWTSSARHSDGANDDCHET